MMYGQAVLEQFTQVLIGRSVKSLLTQFRAFLGQEQLMSTILQRHLFQNGRRSDSRVTSVNKNHDLCKVNTQSVNLTVKPREWQYLSVFT